MSHYDAFISYSSDDQDVAFRLVAQLESHGLRCWIAPRDIDVGHSFPEEIIRGIEGAQAMVVLCSSRSLVSAHVGREVERADAKQKRIVPVFIEDVEPTGALSYYFGSLQHLDVTGRPVEIYAQQIATLLRQPTTATQATDSDITTDTLLALGRSICWDVREVLRRPLSPETRAIVDEPRPGQEVVMVDLEANRRARESVAKWRQRHRASVYLTGEDLDDDETMKDADVVVMLDALDGTQHWLRSRNLWCTALSIFSRSGHDGHHDLSVSFVHLPDERLFFAREDTANAYLDGCNEPIRVRKTRTSALNRAHVCTVARRPGHFRVLNPLLADGSPFAGLYTFAGNPILVELIDGLYDAVFQPDARVVNDAQDLWDWLPGGHILLRAGCTPKSLDGSDLNIVALANAGIRGATVSAPFVAAANETLAQAILSWLAQSHTDQ